MGVSDVDHQGHIRNLNASPADVEERRKEDVVEEAQSAAVIAAPIAEQAVTEGAQESWKNDYESANVPERTTSTSLAFSAV